MTIDCIFRTPFKICLDFFSVRRKNKNSSRKYKKVLLAVILLASFLVSPAVSEIVNDAHTDVELIPEFFTASPGASFYVGLRMKMEDGWHVYWKNPGDSGLPAKIEWELPQGFTAEAIEWPIPERLPTPPFMTYGYENEVVLATRIRIAENAVLNEPLVIRANVTWLACKEVCVPGKATLSFPITLSNETTFNEAFPKVVKPFLQKVPLSETRWNFSLTETKENYLIKITPPDDMDFTYAGAEFFPYESDVIENAAPQIFTAQEKGGLLRVKKLNATDSSRIASVEGVVVFSGIKLPPEEGEEELQRAGVEVKMKPVFETAVAHEEMKEKSVSLFPILLFAFLGGLILNLMPCVLPVLSLKILGLLLHLTDPKKMFRQGILYTCGVLVSFWVLAGILLLLHWAGMQAGWGFQFQSPVFLIAMSFLFFWLGLNLIGVFEIGTSLGQAGTELLAKGGEKKSSSFFNGILAVLVATPCTAPFMGSAVGFALVSPALVSLAIFTALGFGLAFPYLVLCRFPSLLRFLPKPGGWMYLLKKIFGFLFFGTVLWLAWVLGKQKGIDAVFALLWGLFILGIAGGVLQQWGGPEQERNKRRTAFVAVFLLAVFAAFVTWRGTDRSQPVGGTGQNLKTSWTPFSDVAVAAARAEGKSVFIDFTAAWCLTCQVNKQTTFRNPQVIAFLQKENIMTFEADWTTEDAAITEALGRFGKASVPLYVFYPHGQEPVLLPELLTPRIFLEALEKSLKNSEASGG